MHISSGVLGVALTSAWLVTAGATGAQLKRDVLDVCANVDAVLVVGGLSFALVGKCRTFSSSCMILIMARCLFVCVCDPYVH